MSPGLVSRSRERDWTTKWELSDCVAYIDSLRVAVQCGQDVIRSATNKEELLLRIDEWYNWYAATPHAAVARGAAALSVLFIYSNERSRCRPSLSAEQDVTLTTKDLVTRHHVTTQQNEQRLAHKLTLRYWLWRRRRWRRQGLWRTSIATVYVCMYVCMYEKIYDARFLQHSSHECSPVGHTKRCVFSLLQNDVSVSASWIPKWQWHRVPQFWGTGSKAAWSKSGSATG